MKRYQVTYRIVREEVVPVEYEVTGEVLAKDKEMASHKAYNNEWEGNEEWELIECGEPGKLIDAGEPSDICVREIEK